MVSGAGGTTGPRGWFGALWALAVLFHLAGNGAHLLLLDQIGVVQLVLVAAALTMLIRPSTSVAIGLAGLYLLVLWMKLPVVGNHEVILGLVSLVVLLSGLRALRSRSDSNWMVEAAPAARWVLIVSYGFIAVSKLNSGFFDLAGSCALLFTEAFGSAFGMGPGTVEAAGPAAIVITAGVELAIPVLLVLRRFRSAGAVLAVSFHFVLALDPASHVWDFSAVLLPLFLLFMPSEVHRLLDRALARHRLRPPVERTLTLGIVVAAHGVVSTGATPLPTWAVAFPAWLALGGVIGGAAVWMVVGGAKSLMAAEVRAGKSGEGAAASGADGRASEAGTGERREGDIAWRVAGFLVPVVALTALIGLGPYLEYRTAAAFNMYSNLQVVDGVSNHYLIGSLAPRSRASNPPDASPVPESSVLEVVSASDDSPLQYYIERGLALPVENLERYLARHEDDQVTVRVAGTVVPAAEAGLVSTDRSPDLASRLWSSLRYKLAFRRAVDLSPPRQCLRSWGPIG